MKNSAYFWSLALCLLGCAPPAGLKDPITPPAVLPIDVCGALLNRPLQLDRPPAVLPPDRPVRVVAFGDFGDGTWGQMRVAGAIARHDRRQPLDFVLLQCR